MVNDENIRVVNDENNLIVIDPNKVDSVEGVKDRYVDQDKLQMFVNLEADVRPRSAIGYSDQRSDLKQTVARGNINFMGPNNGSPLDTSWVDDFFGDVNSKNLQRDKEGKPLKTVLRSGNDEYQYNIENQIDTQLLGIKDIDIESKPTNLTTTTVKIRMVDVRGRALMEQGENSIYSIFFALPYPIFYLTVKGYYGQSITYQLVLSDQVKLEFDADGDYYLTAQFMSVNQKLLNDIPFKYITNVSELYKNTQNDSNGNIVKRALGQDILKETYEKYLKNGYITDSNLVDYPLNIVEFIEKIKRLNDEIDQSIFVESDLSFFYELSQFQANIENLLKSTTEWFKTYTNYSAEVSEADVFVFNENKVKNMSPSDINHTQSLNYLVETYLNNLRTNPYMGVSGTTEITLRLTSERKKIKFNSPLTRSTTPSFDDFEYDPTTETLKREKFDSKINKLIDKFNEETKIIKEKLQEVITEIQFNTLGFKPTLANVMGVILANLQTFLHIMDKTYKDAINLSKDTERVKSVSTDITQSRDPIKEGNVYPFPTVYKTSNEDDTIEETYPFDPDIRKMTKGTDLEKWPEVKLVREFVESYLAPQDDASEGENIYDPPQKIVIPIDGNYRDKLYNEDNYIDIIYRIYNRALYIATNNIFVKDSIFSEIGVKDSKQSLTAINKLVLHKEVFKNPKISLNTLITNKSYLSSDITRIYDVQEYRQTKTKSTQQLEKEWIENGGIEILEDDGNTADKLKETNEKILKQYQSSEHPIEDIYPFKKEEMVIGSNIQLTQNGQLISFDVSVDIIPENITTLFNHRLFSDDDFSDDILKTRAFLFLNHLNLKDLNETHGEGVKFYSNFLHNNIIQVSKSQILRWGSIWYRHKRFIEDGVDIVEPYYVNPTNDIVKYEGEVLPGDFYPNIGESGYNFQFDFNDFDRVDVGFNPDLIIDKVNTIYKELYYETLDEKYNVKYDIFSIKDIVSDKDDSIVKAEKIESQNINGKRIVKWNVYAVINDEKINIPTYVKPKTPEKTIQEVLNNSFIITETNDTQVIDYNNLNKSPLGTLGYFGKNEPITDLLSLFDIKTLNYFESEFLKFSRHRNQTPDDEISFDALFKTAYNPNKIRFLIDDKITFVKKNTYGIHFPTLYKLTREVNLVDFESYNTDTDIQLIKNKLKYELGLDENIGAVNDIIPLNVGASFYEIFNISFKEDEFYKFKFIIKKWISHFLREKSNNEALTEVAIKESFITKMVLFTDNILEKSSFFVTGMFEQYSKDIGDVEITIEKKKPMITNVDLEKKVYRSLKNISDTWSGAFDFTKTLFPSYFKYLNQVNKPIGHDFLVDVKSLANFYNQVNLDNDNSVGKFISIMLKHNGLSEPLSVGSSVNFYGDFTLDNENRMEDAQTISNKVFGIHDNIIKRGTPIFVIYQRSHMSETLRIDKNKYNLNDDSFDLYMPDNPLSKIQTDTNQMKFGNRSVSFYVDFGVQNQNMFKQFSISSYDGVKTQEELVVLDNLSSKANSSESQVFGSSLLDILKVRTYSCKITTFGNAMIQPFMTFNLRYIPIYSGTYLILSVKHDMSSETGMTTEFEGVRISKYGSPRTKLPFVKENMKILDGLIEKLSQKQKNKIKTQEIYDYPTIEPNLVKLPTPEVEVLEAKTNKSPNLNDFYNINTLNRLAHFLSQTSHESAQFELVEENLNYSAEGLVKTWPHKFTLNPDEVRDTKKLATDYARQPEKIANYVYGNRLGNNEIGDGWKYRGRGFIQVTGKYNYELFNKFLGGEDDVVKNPDLVATKYPLDSAVWFWGKKELNRIADKGEGIEVTKELTLAIRGGDPDDSYLKRYDKFKYYYDKLRTT